jgi:hypothetical protein
MAQSPGIQFAGAIHQVMATGMADNECSTATKSIRVKRLLNRSRDTD